LSNIIKTEFKKIFFRRSSRIYILALIAVSVLLGILFVLTTNVTQGRAITELSRMDILSANMLGLDLANIMLIVFTAITISREFRTNLISISLGVIPNRKRFFLGKLITYFLLSAVISIVTVGFIFLTSQVVLAANGMTLISISERTVSQFVFGIMSMPLFYTLLTVAAVFIFRNSAGAITFSLGIMALPAFVRMFSNSIQQLILPVFPESAINSLAGTVESGTSESLSITISLLLLFIWVFIVSIAAIIRFRRQDF